MIPALDENGYLPPGTHRATLAEIAERFGHGSELRRDQAESLRWLVDGISRLHLQRLVVDGSFVTDEPEPNDVDCVALGTQDYPFDVGDEAEWKSGYPFLHIQIVGAAEFAEYIDVVFGTDRRGIAKGVVEVIL